MGISTSAIPSLSDENFLFVMCYICQKFICALVIYHCSQRYVNKNIISAFAEHFFGTAILTFCSGEFSFTPEIHKRIQFRSCSYKNGSAFTAVATAWSPAGNIFLPSERNHTISAGTGNYNNFCLVYKHKYLIVI